MEKNLKKELQEMKFLFGYKPGKVISEQHIPMEEVDFEMDDVMFADPDVMEPEVKPDTDRGVEERPSRPGRPDRDPNRLPYTDPDTHPQGEHEDEIEYEFEFGDDDVNEPFVDDVDSEYENSDLADLVNKYLSNRD